MEGCHLFHHSSTSHMTSFPNLSTPHSSPSSHLRMFSFLRPYIYPRRRSWKARCGERAGRGGNKRGVGEAEKLQRQNTRIQRLRDSFSQGTAMACYFTGHHIRSFYNVHIWWSVPLTRHTDMYILEYSVRVSK